MSRPASTDVRADARRLAAELLDRHGEAEGKAAFLTEIGRRPYSAVLGSAEAVQIFADALPTPPPPPEKKFTPPAVADPTGRDRWQVIRDLTEYGVRPESLAGCAIQLYEADVFTLEESIAWAKQKMQAGNLYAQPWLQETNELLAKARA